jgi:hypothetical protein
VLLRAVGPTLDVVCCRAQLLELKDLVGLGNAYSMALELGCLELIVVILSGLLDPRRLGH